MHIVIVTTDYPSFLKHLYTANPELKDAPYEEQRRVRLEAMFGGIDAYPRYGQALGHQIEVIWANNTHMQQAWMRDYLPSLQNPRSLSESLRRVRSRLGSSALAQPLKPLLRPLLDRQGPSDISQWAMAAQLDFYHPDVVVNMSMDGVPCGYLNSKDKPFLVGNHAAAPLPWNDVECYELVISCFPPTVEMFANRGVPARFLRLGFDTAVAETLSKPERTIDVSFVGSLAGIHTSRIQWLEQLCHQIPQLQIWGPSIGHLPSHSPIRSHYRGAAWGRDMFDVLRRSKITLNHHGNIEPIASNSRLYEATGCGALLITDDVEGLSEIFNVDKEVAAYQDAYHCAELIRFFLREDEARCRIAEAGLRQTLNKHTARQRVHQFLELVSTERGLELS